MRSLRFFTGSCNAELVYLCLADVAVRTYQRRCLTGVDVLLSTRVSATDYLQWEYATSLTRGGYKHERLFEKYQAASRLSIKRVIATYTNVSLVVGNSS
jgi:hypothetical protein